ncbi:MAG TPA: hypothetical protein GX526_06355 [Thermoanaerobacterales bacterium]|nr:hypothetical protein [Thermoanaerobacterales bacterium]
MEGGQPTGIYEAFARSDRRELVGMKNILKTIWKLAIILTSTALIWFLLGSTAFFQRFYFDLVEFAYFISVWVPTLVLMITFIFLIKKGWIPRNLILQVVITIIILIVSISVSTALFKNTTLYGWIIKQTRIDYVQVTDDGKYEYQLALTNLFQRNSYARLLVTDVSTDDEMIIPIKIRTKEISGITVPSKTVPKREEPPLPSFVWCTLNATDKEAIYMFTTTKYLKESIEMFEINMDKKKAKRIN